MKFETTHWTWVEHAQAGGEHADRALALLCERYWKPLYVYARRRGYGAEDAQDIVQGFFLRLIDKSFLEAADADKGRFRTFLLTCLQRYMANEYQRETAAKRGGLAMRTPVDWRSAESALANAAAPEVSADVLFDREWAMVVIARAMERLKASERKSGRGQLIEAIGPQLVTGLAEVDYEGLAKRLGTTRGAARVAMHRLRKRLGDFILEEVGQTVRTPEEAETELRYLLQAMG